MSPFEQPGPLAFLWEDAETTGLSVDDHLIEITVIATDQDLRELETFTTLVRPQSDTFDRIASDDVVHRMHERNGLLADLHAHGAGAPTEAEVERQLIDLFERHVVPGAPPVRLAGGGVAHFDFPYLQHRMPVLAGRLHYRPLDVTQVAQAYTSATGSDLFGEKRNKAHRSEADIREDLDRARTFWQMFRQIDSASDLPKMTGRDSIAVGAEIIRSFESAKTAPDTGSGLSDLRMLVGSVRDSDALAGVTAIAAHLAASLSSRTGLDIDGVLNGARRSLTRQAPSEAQPVTQ